MWNRWKQPRPAVSAYISCSFCGIGADQAKRIVTGTGGAAICETCIDMCKEICLRLEGHAIKLLSPPLNKLGEK